MSPEAEAAERPRKGRDALRGEGRPSSYRLKDGTRVPGTTTIVNRFKESGGLIHWAYECGVNGIDYRKSRDDAADVGHYAHALVDATVHDVALPDPPQGMSGEDAALGRKALESFLAWRDQVRLEIVDTEIPAVSETHRFGGTRDVLARANGVLMLGDWKSSNAVYRDYICQVAAYRQLAREQGHVVDSAFLLRFGKTYGDFTHHFFPSEVLDLGWDAFLYMRALYDVDQKLKQVIR